MLCVLYVNIVYKRKKGCQFLFSVVPEWETPESLLEIGHLRHQRRSAKSESAFNWKIILRTLKLETITLSYNVILLTAISAFVKSCDLFLQESFIFPYPS